MKVCELCGKTLTSAQRNNRFCSNECANKAKAQRNLQQWLAEGFKERKELPRYARQFFIHDRGNCCELCGWNKINPVTGVSPLEIHHLDGDCYNNDPSNIQVLCPNCHSLTENYKSLNTQSDRQRTQTRKNHCVDCGAEITSDALRCKKCAGAQRVTAKPVDREELKALIRTESFVAIGKMFDVTDNAIRKWCIQYNLPSKRKDINAYSDAEWAMV